MKAGEFERKRKKLGLSQEALAKEFGVSYHSVFRWENGKWPVPRLAELAFTGLESIKINPNPGT